MGCRGLGGRGNPGTYEAHGVHRSRSALMPSEPAVGRFISWRVLGFGGTCSPLLYARVASFAARSAQALLMGRDAADGLAEMLLGV